MVLKWFHDWDAVSSYVVELPWKLHRSHCRLLLIVVVIASCCHRDPPLWKLKSEEIRQEGERERERRKGEHNTNRVCNMIDIWVLMSNGLCEIIIHLTFDIRPEKLEKINAFHPKFTWPSCPWIFRSNQIGWVCRGLRVPNQPYYWLLVINTLPSVIKIFGKFNWKFKGFFV